MSDDALGPTVSEYISKFDLCGVRCYQEAVGGLDMLPIMYGYKFVVIIDAIQTAQYEPGTVMIFDESEFDDVVFTSTTHDINLPTAIKIGRKMSPKLMPDIIKFVAVEAEDTITLSEKMTQKVNDAIENTKDAVLYIISEFRNLS